jgi:hypothetical protein
MVLDRESGAGSPSDRFREAGDSSGQDSGAGDDTIREFKGNRESISTARQFGKATRTAVEIALIYAAIPLMILLAVQMMVVISRLTVKPADVVQEVIKNRSEINRVRKDIERLFDEYSTVRNKLMSVLELEKMNHLLIKSVFDKLNKDTESSRNRD